MTAKERVWISEAIMRHPKQWIVLANCLWDNEEKKHYGEIFLVTDNEREAIKVSKELEQKGSMGSVSVFEGFDDTPCVGGLSIICTQ